MPHQCKVYLGMFGHGFDPARLEIGIGPTTVMIQAEPRPKHSAWIYGTVPVTAVLLDVSAMASQLVETLLPYETKLLAAVKTHNLEVVLQVVLTLSFQEDDPMPVIGFDDHVLGFLHRLGGDIDIDTYRDAS